MSLKRRARKLMGEIRELGPKDSIRALKREQEFLGVLLTALLRAYARAGSPLLTKGIMAELKAIEKAADTRGNKHKAVEKAIGFVNDLVAETGKKLI